jgi:hypothetical protein
MPTFKRATILALLIAGLLSLEQMRSQLRVPVLILVLSERNARGGILVAMASQLGL